MGANLSQEQLDSLERFRTTVVTLLDISLEHTPHDHMHVSMQRLRVCRDQVEIITPFMLIELAKIWKKSCSELHAVIRQKQSTASADHFLEDFRGLKLKLPSGGSTEDIYFVVQPLPENFKARIMHLFLESVDHIDNARLDEKAT